MVGYCRRFRERTGTAPDIVGIQNELLQPPDLWREMALRLRAELNRSGFQTVKIHMQDAGSAREAFESVRAFRGDADTWSAIDYSAAHPYDYQEFFTDPDAYDSRLRQLDRDIGGKPFLSTEVSVHFSDWQAPSYRLALSMGQLYHKILTILNAKALLYTWLLLNVEQPSYGASRSLFVPDPGHGFVPAPSSNQLRVFGAYSRRIREGMTRLEATSSDPDILVTAFSAADGARTLVILNRSPRTHRLRLDWEGPAFRFLETVDPYNENSVREVPATLTIAPGSIETLSTVELNR
jgi:hypothetical protein